MLSTKRDAAAARRFFRKALKQLHTLNPRTIAVDKSAAYPIAAKALKPEGTLWRFAKLRQAKFLNTIVEQDHGRIKQLVRSRLGFKSFVSVAQTIAGYEVVAIIRKGQVVSAPANDMKGQTDFISALLSATASPGTQPALT
nr:transposase [Microvirga ossetica]